MAWLKERGYVDASKPVKAIPVTWTGWDFKIQMQRECQWRELKRPVLFNGWIDIKKCFLERYGSRSKISNLVAWPAQPKGRGGMRELFVGHLIFLGTVMWAISFLGPVV